MSRIEGPSAKDPDALSKHKRHFCGLCGSALYASDERWAENVYAAFATDSTDGLH